LDQPDVNLDWPTLVIAPTYERFRLWCTRNGRNPRNRNLCWVNGPEKLYGWGRANVVVLDYPLWWTADDFDQLGAIEERSK
jgi:hypothetical protein